MTLTPAQERVASLVAEGLTYRTIGQRLGCSWRTVKGHVERIADKLPTDELPPKSRVQIWAIRRAI